MSEMREKLGSRLGFILLSAACAIGIGNVWRFPYVAGQSGGGWFVLIYLACLALLGLPVLLMEFAAGRAAQRSIAKLHSVLTPEKPLWRVHGVVGSLGLLVLMMFYTVVTAWMVLYFIKTAAGSLSGLDVAGVKAAFEGEHGMLADPLQQTCAMVGVCLVSAGVCAIGLEKGLERVTKWMMLALLMLIVVLAVHSLTLDGAEKGLRFYLVPDTAQLMSVGVGTVVGHALQQAFFTLSLGIGSMAIFGSYIGKDHALLGEGLNVVALDTFVALCAGLIILPACSAFGIDYAGGPSLVFETLPNVFNKMSGGRFWGSMFFLFMSFAALTTVLAVFEGIIASLRDYTGWGRLKASVALGIAMPILSLPCIFGFNLWSGFHPLGGTSNVLDLEDFLVSDLALPLGGLAFALYSCHRFGWGWKSFLAEVNAGRGLKFPNVLRAYCAYVLPVLVAAIIAISLYERFRPVNPVFPWENDSTEEDLREWVEPDTVLCEPRDDWRPVFTPIFADVVKNCTNATAAVQAINRVIWERLGVQYSTKRDAALQSPFHSMRTHKASCTGMAILQVCAYRSVGIPARLVGCNWTTLRGNHSWVEFKEKGTWHFFGDGDPSTIDESWIAPFAAEADASRPDRRIYATRATHRSDEDRCLHFWTTWEPGGGWSPVPADDVTESYRRFRRPDATADLIPENANYQKHQ